MIALKKGGEERDTYSMLTPISRSPKKTCIAPDYLVVTSVSTRDKLIAAIKETLSEWYKSSPEIQSKDYSGIISDGHFSRLKSLLAETKGEILVDGSVDETSRKMGVTIVSCGVDDKLLEEEIFGPILPLITVGEFFSFFVDTSWPSPGRLCGDGPCR